MSALFLLIGISLLVASGFLAAFLWLFRHSQFYDTQTRSSRALFDRWEGIPKSEAQGKKKVLKKA